jgi:3-oxosteroid 1-dehydrogenase
MSDPEAPHPNLAPLDWPPCYAVELLPEAVGTKGGLMTSVDSEVLDWDGEAIHDL